MLHSRECYLLRYTDTDVDAWYHEALDFAVGSGYMGGVAADRFDPEGTLTRAMLATILYRMSGETGGSHPFTDVPANEWYADAVAWAYTAGVVNGTGPTLFSPQEPVTREQTAAMLYRYAAHMGEDTKPQGNLSAFRDAEEISEYAKIALGGRTAYSERQGEFHAGPDRHGDPCRNRADSFEPVQGDSVLTDGGRDAILLLNFILFSFCGSAAVQARR